MLLYFYLAYRFYWPEWKIDPYAGYYATFTATASLLGSILTFFVIKSLVISELTPPLPDDVNVEDPAEAAPRLKASHLTIFGLLIFAINRMCKTESADKK